MVHRFLPRSRACLRLDSPLKIEDPPMVYRERGIRRRKHKSPRSFASSERQQRPCVTNLLEREDRMIDIEARPAPIHVPGAAGQGYSDLVEPMPSLASPNS